MEGLDRPSEERGSVWALRKLARTVLNRKKKGASRKIRRGRGRIVEKRGQKKLTEREKKKRGERGGGGQNIIGISGRKMAGRMTEKRGNTPGWRKEKEGQGI